MKKLICPTSPVVREFTSKTLDTGLLLKSTVVIERVFVANWEKLHDLKEILVLCLNLSVCLGVQQVEKRLFIRAGIPGVVALIPMQLLRIFAERNN